MRQLALRHRRPSHGLSRDPEAAAASLNAMDSSVLARCADAGPSGVIACRGTMRLKPGLTLDNLASGMHGLHLLARPASDLRRPVYLESKCNIMTVNLIGIDVDRNYPVDADARRQRKKLETAAATIQDAFALFQGSVQ